MIVSFENLIFSSAAFFRKVVKMNKSYAKYSFPLILVMAIAARISFTKDSTLVVTLKGLCKAKRLHLHRAEKSKYSPLKSMARTCC